MNLAGVYKHLSTLDRVDDETRGEWQSRLVHEGLALLREHDLLSAAAIRWLEQQAQNITGNKVKRAGLMPRAAAGQIVVWPEMEAIAGRNALRRYVRQYKGVVSRHEFCARILGYLNAEFETDAAIAKHPDLRSALIAAGASTEDILRLSEMAA